MVSASQAKNYRALGALFICRIKSRMLTVPLDDGGRLDQYHRVQTARPQSVEPDPEQAVDREQPGPTRPLATKNVQRRRWNARVKHTRNIMAVYLKTLGFSALSEFQAQLSPNAHASFHSTTTARTLAHSCHPGSEESSPSRKSVACTALAHQRLHRGSTPPFEGTYMGVFRPQSGGRPYVFQIAGRFTSRTNSLAMLALAQIAVPMEFLVATAAAELLKRLTQAASRHL
jgi:hypothetical protein